MKRWLLASVFTLLPLSALAECRFGTDGSAACGYHCVVNGYGKAVCAESDDQVCLVDGHGEARCGYNCIADGNDGVACADTPEQTCALDSFGRAVCV
jgi:hypothetical protein